MNSDQLATDRSWLVERLADADYAGRFTAVGAQIEPSIAPESAVRLLREGVEALGAEQAVFISFVRHHDRLLSCRFMLACDPAWCRDYLDAAGIVHDPWLIYATHHVEPVIASTVGDPANRDEPQQRVLDIAACHGFRSAIVAPVHCGAGHSRSSVLYLGSSTHRYFEAVAATDGFRLLRIGARLLAAQLHDWWLARVRDELLRRARLTDTELALLRYEQQGLSSKQITDATRFSKSSVDSRFHRINLKLGVPNRRVAARLAVEAGLIRVEVRSF